MKITVTPPRPRNPLVAPTRMRRAGSHRQAIGGARPRAAQDLRRELATRLSSP